MNISPALAAKYTHHGGSGGGSSTPAGYDISYPQCGGAYPSSPLFGIVGVGGGRPYSPYNSCLASEYNWALKGSQRIPAFYVNTANPGTASTRWTNPGPQPCSGSATDTGCAYNYGWNATADAVNYAQTTLGISAAGHDWWLDIETANSWNYSALSTNIADIQGALDYLNHVGASLAGVYSVKSNWTQIVGSTTQFSTVPNWVAGASSLSSAPSYCSQSMSGGKVVYSQYPSGGYDADYVC